MGGGEVCIINGSRHEDVLHPRVGNVAHISRLVPANVGETSDDFTAVWAIWTNLKKTHTYNCLVQCRPRQVYKKSVQPLVKYTMTQMYMNSRAEL